MSRTCTPYADCACAEYDALDAFLVHTWAVTVTGAPKVWAMQFVEDNEKNARAWYAGAVGGLRFNGEADGWT